MSMYIPEFHISFFFQKKSINVFFFISFLSFQFPRGRQQQQERKEEEEKSTMSLNVEPAFS